MVLAILLVVNAGTSMSLQCYCEADLPLSDNGSIATAGLTWLLHFPIALKRAPCSDKIFVGQGVLEAEISHRHSAQYQNSALPKSSVCEWHTMFENGYTSVTNCKQSVHPSLC